MQRRKKEGRKVTLVLDPELVERAKRVTYEARDTLSNFVNTALAVRLSRFEVPTEYVAKKRERHGRSPASGLFDLRVCHPCGLPIGTPASLYFSKTKPDDEVRNLRALVEHDPSGAFNLLTLAWESAGLDTYTPEHWTATAAWFKNNPTGTIVVNPSTDEARADWEQ